MSIGIMDQAYFISSTQVLSWINSTLSISINKIESLGNGSVYCQLLDVVFPGKVNLSKVNWKASQEHQILANLKLLITSMDKLHVQKHIDILKISKCKYQDNLELAQWFKKYVETHSKNIKEYNAMERRGGIQIQNGKHIVGLKIVKEPVETKNGILKKRELAECKVYPKKLMTKDQKYLKQIETIILNTKALDPESRIKRIKQIVLKIDQNVIQRKIVQPLMLVKPSVQSTTLNPETTCYQKLSTPNFQYPDNTVYKFSELNNQNNFQSANKKHSDIDESIKSLVKSAKPRPSENLLQYGEGIVE